MLYLWRIAILICLEIVENEADCHQLTKPGFDIFERKYHHFYDFYW